LRQRASELLCLVGQGETIEITDRGRRRRAALATLARLRRDER
jgi:antitoxin (DNA-binding transcriptional repressor) of toxin-antitoxin stability system